MAYEPSWKQYEKQIHTAPPQEAEKALDAFLQERDKELKVNPKAREYEKSRRERLAKDKPEWVKSKRKEDSRDLIKEGLERLKDGGEFLGVRPVAGYVLVKPDTPEPVELAGIIIEEEDDRGSNKGEVIEIGGELALEKTIMKPPVGKGDKVMYKWFAGIDVLVKGEPMKLMQFTDLLAVIDD